jgi:H+/gluconate symporter-like permease
MAAFVGFFKNNFLIFLAGAVMGKVYEVTYGAKAVARLIVSKIGKKWSLASIPIACGLLTYGGISGFVLGFTILPIALEVFREGDIPRRFIPVTLIFGICTYGAIAPGSPQVGNIVLNNALGTPIMSGAIIGFITVAVIFIVGMMWLFKLVKKAKANGEHFVAKETDVFNDNAVCPNGAIALIPLVLALLAINIKVGQSTILPAEYGIFLGAFLAYFMLRKYKTDDRSILEHLSDGVKNALLATGNTSAVVGFGGVVKVASGFQGLMGAIMNIPGPKLLALSIVTTIIAGICGSGSGGLGIVAPIFGPIYTELGFRPEVLHRMMLIASSGLDTLPHNGFVVTILGLCHESHKDSYYPIFGLTIIKTLTAISVGVVLFTLFPNLP